MCLVERTTLEVVNAGLIWKELETSIVPFNVIARLERARRQNHLLNQPSSKRYTAIFATLEFQLRALCRNLHVKYYIGFLKSSFSDIL